jgi:hypothetical protein
MGNPFLRTSPLAVAAALLVATRVPGDHAVWAVTAVAGAVLLVLLGLLYHWTVTPTWMRRATFLLALLLLLVPTTPHALLGFLPAWLVAIFLVLALHVLFRSDDGMAPEVEGRSHVASWHHGLRYLPAVMAASALVTLPMLYGVMLPERFHAAYELRTALAPLLPLVLLTTLLIAAGAVHTLTGHAVRAARSPQRSRDDRDQEGEPA